MNKIVISCSLILFLFLIVRPGKAQEGEDIGVDGYENLAAALKHPEKATKIWITGNAAQVKLLTDRSASFTHLTAFKIKDATSDEGWEQLFSAISKISSVKEIELTFNEIKNIPFSISNFKNLDRLIIWGSWNLDYEGLFQSLKGLKKFRSLELNSNGLISVPSGIKELSQLEQFTITDNENVNYTDLVEKLSSLPKLQDLSLEVNAITQLPANIIKLNNLKKLNISNNYITSFPDNMSEMKSLDSLNADGNLFVNYVDEYNKLKGINISYISLDGGLSEEEKAELLKLFPKAKLDEKASVDTPENAPVSADKQDLFEPLIPALNVPKTNYSVNANEGGQVNYPSGTRINIPPDAFVDKNNTAISGSVTLAYREFSNPADIAFSGIPMMYSKETVSYPMESAGMFQINAFQNDQPVYLKKGKTIDVSLVTSDTTDNYDVYHVDPETKEWVDDGKKGTIKIAKPKDFRADSLEKYAPKSLELSPAWRRYQSILHADDTVLFKDRFYDTAYCYTYKIMPNDKTYYRRVRVSRYKKDNKLTRKQVKGEIWFNVKSPYSIVPPNPEMRAFNGMTWVYDGAETPKEFSAKYLRRKKYSDMRIERNGDSFTMLLKEKSGIISLPVHPINKYKGLVDKAAKTYDRRYKNYTKALARRESSFNKSLMLNQQAVYRNNIKVWQSLKPIMSDSEKTMSYDKWLMYCITMSNTDTLTRFQKSSSFVGSVINQNTRTIPITQFGYFNCDRPLLKIIALPVNAVDAVVRSGYKAITEPKEYVTINASYTDMNEKNLSPKQVVIIDKRIKSAAYLGNGSSMRIAVNSPKNLIAVMNDGSVGVFSENRFKETDLGNLGRYNFKLAMYGPNQLNELKRYLQY